RPGHRRAVPAGAGLPDGGCALVRADGDHPGAGVGLRVASRDGGAGLMATLTTPTQGRALPTPTPPRRRKGPIDWLREHIIQIVAFFVFIYMLLPNLIVILFSFNQPAGKYNYDFVQFSLNAWLHPCAPPG